MKLDKLLYIINDLPKEWSFFPNSIGNLAIWDSKGKYIGFVDFKMEILCLDDMDEL